MYADDTKVFREIKDDLDREKLQEDIYSMYEWSERWLLRFHPDKCKTMHIGNNNSEQICLHFEIIHTKARHLGYGYHYLLQKKMLV